MATLVVTYPTRDGASFDGSYYLDTHIPLVGAKWGSHGLVSARGLLANEPTPAYAAVAVLDFDDDAAIDRALGSPEAADVFGDIVNFTALSPVAFRGK